MFKNKSTLVLVIYISTLIQSMAQASDKPTVVLSASPAAGSLSPATSPTTSTSVDPKAIESSLRDLGDTVKKVYRAATSLQSECNRAINLDAWDNVIMDPWSEGQPGLAAVEPPPFPGAMKPVPARKKWVEYDQNQVTQLLKILTSEINEISGASTIDPTIRVNVEVMQDTLQQVDAQYGRLNALTHPSAVDAKGQPGYDKLAITKTAQALKDETSGLNEIRKRLLRQISEFEKK